MVLLLIHVDNILVQIVECLQVVRLESIIDVRTVRSILIGIKKIMHPSHQLILMICDRIVLKLLLLSSRHSFQIFFPPLLEFPQSCTLCSLHCHNHRIEDQLLLICELALMLLFLHILLFKQTHQVLVNKWKILNT